MGGKGEGLSSCKTQDVCYRVKFSDHFGSLIFFSFGKDFFITSFYSKTNPQARR